MNNRAQNPGGLAGQSAARPLTPVRVLAMVALVVGALWLGWKSWQVNITLSCWKNEWPHLAVCGDIVGRTPAEQIARLQERLAQNPGDAEAKVLLANWASSPDATPGLNAPALLAAAIQAAPQDGRVLRLQADDALSQQQWPEALDPLIRLSRYHGDAQAAQVLAVLVGNAGGDEKVMAALMAATQADGGWLDRPLRALPKAGLPVGNAMPLILALMDKGELTPPLGQFLIGRLKSEERWMEAHAIWRHLWNRAVPLVFNGDFEQPFVRGGFDWEVADGNDHRSGVRVNTVGRGERGQVLQVSFTGKAMKPPVLRQDLVLFPGTYSLSGRMQSSDLRSEQGLAWVVSCAKDGRELARSPALKAGGRDWTSWRVALTMPADCTGFGAKLALQTFAPFEAKTGLRGEALFDDLQIKPESAQP
jgi:hypothetical protein